MERKMIGVISGKGGVGKTSLTASLAYIANNDSNVKPIIMDCDVDAPNLALILPAKNSKEIDSQDTYTTKKATFIEEQCVHCKQCIDEKFCEFRALHWDEEQEIPFIDPLACEGCGACKVLCPEHAFSINVVKSGEIISYETSLNPLLIYGKTELGSTTSGKLVSECKQQLEDHHEFQESNLIIIDGPPGIGCPVIATVSGLDYIICITEPTPSGLHDMKRTIELVEQFGIPFGIVLNKADIKTPFLVKINEFLEEQSYEILGRIPFSYTIPRAMAYSQPVVQYDPISNASIAIKEIYENIKRILQI